MSDENGHCDSCGRFMAVEPKSGSWAHKYDFVAMGQICTRIRCGACTDRLGPLYSNARPHNGDMSPYEGQFSPAPPDGRANNG